ncbi:MAG: Maf family nucleotide pyrophosphatase [Clostridiales Family XIII bacterium]|jgi:septum formation protein|nr:Maf family nucleotide pyrophosphatase [Clostridiales Family XIII bacterium]
MTIHILGPVVGIVTFVIIGLFHPLVVKTEYHIGKKIWPLFLVCGLAFTTASMLIANPYLSVILAIIAFTCFWTIVELHEQEKRVAKGWHPRKPKPQGDSGKTAPEHPAYSVTIALASASPRRRDILNAHGINPVIIPSNADESIGAADSEQSSVDELAMRIAHMKAAEVYERLRALGGNYEKRVIILGADTVIDKDGLIGKPADADDAFRILSLLRNTTHRVITGVSLIDLASGAEQRFADVTEVTFKDYPDEEIWRFIREEQPFDKSGAYAVQSSWSVNVARVDGDIENVIGLPWARIEKELQ